MSKSAVLEDSFKTCSSNLAFDLSEDSFALFPFSNDNITRLEVLSFIVKLAGFSSLILVTFNNSKLNVRLFPLSIVLVPLNKPFMNSDDSITISDELYKVDNEKALWLPSEMFSNIKPIGSELSAVAAIGGLKNSYIFQGEDPDYIPLIQNLKSVKTGQKIGLGENAVFSLPHAEGLTLEYHLLTNGIIGYNEHGQLKQLFKKKNLNKIEEFDPMDVEHKTYEIITSSTNHEAAETPPAQNKTDNERENQVIRMKATSNIERGEEICSSCGSTRFRPQEGCHGGICLDCGETTCG